MMAILGVIPYLPNNALDHPVRPEKVENFDCLFCSNRGYSCHLTVHKKAEILKTHHVVVLSSSPTFVPTGIHTT